MYVCVCACVRAHTRAGGSGEGGEGKDPQQTLSETLVCLRMERPRQPGNKMGAGEPRGRCGVSSALCDRPWVLQRQCRATEGVECPW